MNIVVEVLFVEIVVFYWNIFWSFFGVVILNVINKGRLEVGLKILEIDELGFYEIMVLKFN